MGRVPGSLSAGFRASLKKWHLDPAEGIVRFEDSHYCKFDLHRLHVLQLLITYPGSAPVSRGDSPWRWRRGGAPATHGPRRGSEARLTAPATAPPLPPPAVPRSPVSARRRVCHKQTQLGHTWTAEQLRPATDRGLRTTGLRKPEPPGRAGKRTELRLGTGHCHLAPLPPHGSAAAAAAAALAFRGPSRQRVQALL